MGQLVYHKVPHLRLSASRTLWHPTLDRHALPSAIAQDVLQNSRTKLCIQK